MHIEDIMLEVTRKCNLDCCHCLRGNAQNKTMSPEVINSLFDNVSSIGTLMIGGGEPTLAIETIEYVYEALIQHNVAVDNVFMVTNGKRPRRRLLNAFELLYSHANDNSSSEFAISNDRYHQEARGNHCHPETYINFLREGLFVPEDTIVEHTTNKVEMRVLARGRAKDWGDRHKEYLDCLKLDDIQTPSAIYGHMYVCYDGTVVGDCDMSYEDMKKPEYRRGNVLDWHNMMDQLVQSTIENYKHCSTKCDYGTHNCHEWWACEKTIAQIKQGSPHTIEKGQ